MIQTKHISKSLQLAAPVVITQIGQIMVNLVDTAMVGKLGKQELASVSLGNAVFFMVLLFGIGFSFSLSPLVSQSHAKNDVKSIQNYYKHGMILNVVIAIALMLLTFLAMPILNYLNQPDEVLPDAKTFLTINLLSLIPIMMFQTFRQVSEGISYIYVVSVATITANLVNVFFNYTLIYGHLGMPRLEVEGSAYATLISRIYMLIFILIALYRNKKTRMYFQTKWNQFQMSMFKKISKLGFPTAFQMFFEVGTFAAAAFICGYNEQTNEISAHQIVITLASISFMICTGLSVASTIRIGNELGLKNYASIREIGKTNLILVTLFMAFCGVIFIVFRNSLPELFLKKEDSFVIVIIASKLMIIAAFFQILDGLQVVALGALRGLQDVKIPTLITFVAYFAIALPLGWYLAITENMKAFGMWIALGIGLGVSAAMLLYRFWYMTKRFSTT